MTTIKELRSKRIAAEIPATLLAAKSGINRSRLSNFEHGYIQASEEEIERLASALAALIAAKAAVDRVAASVGWSVGVRNDH